MITLEELQRSTIQVGESVEKKTITFALWAFVEEWSLLKEVIFKHREEGHLQ